MLTKTVRILLFGSISMLMLATYLNCAETKSTTGSGQNNPQEKTGCFEQLGTNSEWSNEVEVPIDGYAANAMEPKISADQNVLFFNDKPTDDMAMNLHYAVKQANGRFQYIGTVPGTVDHDDLDGVPALDIYGNFYFSSTRTYFSNYQTLHGGQIVVTGPNALTIANLAAVDNLISRKTIYLFDMDMDVSWDGTLAVVSRADFTSHLSYPDKSYLDLFSISNRVLNKIENSLDILRNVNLSACRVYAPTLSPDKKELYYTVLAPKPPSNELGFGMVVAKRNNVNEVFGPGALITGITGQLTEGASISYDDGGKTLYYHKQDPTTSRLKIYKVTRP